MSKLTESSKKQETSRNGLACTIGGYVTRGLLAFQVFGDSCDSVVIEDEGLQSRKLWEAFEDDHIVV